MGNWVYTCIPGEGSQRIHKAVPNVTCVRDSKGLQCRPDIYLFFLFLSHSISFTISISSLSPSLFLSSLFSSHILWLYYFCAQCNLALSYRVLQPIRLALTIYIYTIYIFIYIYISYNKYTHLKNIYMYIYIVVDAANNSHIAIFGIALDPCNTVLHTMLIFFYY